MGAPQTITEVYEKLAAEDEGIRKLAEEQDAAGRIMARGFADELSKLAEFGGQPSFGGPSGDTIKTGPYQTGGTDKKIQGAMGEGPVVFGGRKSRMPEAFKSESAAVAADFGRKPRRTSGERAEMRQNKPLVGSAPKRPEMVKRDADTSLGVKLPG